MKGESAPLLLPYAQLLLRYAHFVRASAARLVAAWDAFGTLRLLSTLRSEAYPKSSRGRRGFPLSVARSWVIGSATTRGVRSPTLSSFGGHVCDELTRA